MKCFNFAKEADNRIVIQVRSESSTDYGGQSGSWSAENTVWAVINSSGSSIFGREVFIQGQNQSRVSHKFIIRYISAYKDTAETAKRRISFDDRIFNIRNIRNLDDTLKKEGTAYQEIWAEENGAEYV